MTAIELTEAQKAQARSLTKTQRRLLRQCVASVEGVYLDRSYGNCFNGGKLVGFVTRSYFGSARSRRNTARITPLGYTVAAYLASKDEHG